MAKGNLLLGTAGNSVGDVVMYRREGAQVSRVRVRKIKNPKTDAQSLQRAAFSPVAKFYSPLAIVLERSYEGLSKMKSYNKFLKTNIDLARANGWLLPKGTGFFPLPYQLSQGSLPTCVYELQSGSNALHIVLANSETAITTIGQLSSAFIGLGYQENDIVTFIVVGKDTAGNYFPLSAQFIINTTSTDLISSISDSINFSVNGQYNQNFDVTVKSGTNQAGAVIVSRWQNEKWRRSTQQLAVLDNILTEIAAADYKAAAIASYGMNAGDPNPLVYLDGDTLEG